MSKVFANDIPGVYGARQFIVDAKEDIPKIDVSVIEPGSVIFVINDSSRYMLNSKKDWIKIASPNNGGSGGGGDIGGGGAPGGGGDSTIHPDYDGGWITPPVR